jgi:hypothetical protein
LDLASRTNELRQVSVVIAVIFCTVPLVAGMQGTSLRTDYASFQVSLWAIDDKTLTANMSLNMQAHIDNRSAPQYLQVQIFQDSSRYVVYDVYAYERTDEWAYYSSNRFFSAQLSKLNSVLYPYDSYSLNLSVRVVPTYAFSPDSLVEAVDSIVVQQYASNISWNITASRTIRAFIAPDEGITLSGIRATLKRQNYVINQTMYPIYGLIWLIGGAMGIEARKNDHGGVVNRLTVFVTAFIGLTGYSLITGSNLPSSFTLPSMSGLLVEGVEIATVFFVFATIVDGLIDDERKVLFIDIIFVTLMLYVNLNTVLVVNIPRYVGYNIGNLPGYAMFLVIAGLLSGIVIRIAYFAKREYLPHRLHGLGSSISAD